MYNIEGAEWILKWAGNLAGKKVLEFGNQHIWEHAQTRLGINYNIARDWFLQYHKVDEYESIDLNGEDGAIAYDLTMPTPIPSEAFANRFDVVTNIGTTEHCGKEDEAQFYAFQKSVECAKIGGVILHQLPPEGMWLDHCDVWYRDGLGDVLAEVFGCTLLKEERINLSTLNPSIDYLCIALRKEHSVPFLQTVPKQFSEKLAR